MKMRVYCIALHLVAGTPYRSNEMHHFAGRLRDLLNWQIEYKKGWIFAHLCFVICFRFWSYSPLKGFGLGMEGKRSLNILANVSLAMFM